MKFYKRKTRLLALSVLSFLVLATIPSCSDFDTAVFSLEVPIYNVTEGYFVQSIAMTIHADVDGIDGQTFSQNPIQPNSYDNTVFNGGFDIDMSKASADTPYTLEITLGMDGTDYTATISGHLLRSNSYYSDATQSLNFLSTQGDSRTLEVYLNTSKALML